MHGPPTILACSTCIASIGWTTRPPRLCFSERLPWIHISPALTRDCRSFTFKLHSWGTRTTLPERLSTHAGSPSEGWNSIHWIRSSTSRWGEPTGSKETWKAASAGSSDRPLSARTIAQGIYARAWTETMAARSQEARQHVDLAMRLSPLDPLYYAMLGTRAFTHLAVGEDADAADWAEQAARSPGAHVLIAMIAGAAHALNGDATRAAYWAANARERNAVAQPRGFLPLLSHEVGCNARPRVAGAGRLGVLGAAHRHHLGHTIARIV